MNTNKNSEMIEKKLISFLRLFQNRHFHLAKYLIENRCLSEDFLKNISENKKLEDFTNRYEQEIPNIYFSNFKDMIRFFESISSEYNFEDFDEKAQIELNNKLNSLIRDERYEEAIKIRDYMIQNNIKRIT